MCRFLVFKGKKTVVADLVTKPDHSLIKQSYGSKERKIPINGDGFGVGWYDHSRGATPGLFTSLTPAWANLNLTRLADKINADCLFAHVRAATPGFLVSETNCHPFQYKNLLWMHNGVAKEFYKIKRKLRSSLKDPYYDMIQGTTDSEHAFALFLNFLGDEPEKATLPQLFKAITETINQLNQWSEEAGVDGASDFNFAVTNGHEIVVTRYVSHSDRKPETLYISHGESFECNDEGSCRMQGHAKSFGSVVVASEPLTDYSEEWERVAPGTAILINANNEVEIKTL